MSHPTTTRVAALPGWIQVIVPFIGVADHGGAYSARENLFDIRKQYFLLLVRRYQYRPQRIQANRLVPGRSGEFADLVVYGDDAKSQPLVVIDFVDSELDGLMPDSPVARATIEKARRLEATYAVCVARDESLVLYIPDWDSERPAQAVRRDIPMSI